MVHWTFGSCIYFVGSLINLTGCQSQQHLVLATYCQQDSLPSHWWNPSCLWNSDMVQLSDIRCCQRGQVFGIGCLGVDIIGKYGLIITQIHTEQYHNANVGLLGIKKVSGTFWLLICLSLHNKYIATTMQQKINTQCLHTAVHTSCCWQAEREETGNFRSESSQQL